MPWIRTLLLALLFTLAISACSDDSDSSEVVVCTDGTQMEIFRSDQPDTDGNVARIRFRGADDELVDSGDRVNEADLSAAVAKCRAE